MAKINYHDRRGNLARENSRPQQQPCSRLRNVMVDRNYRNRPRWRLSVSTRVPPIDAFMATVFVVVHQLLVARSSDGMCVFPDFVQSNVTWSNPTPGLVNWSTSAVASGLIRDWRTRVVTTNAGGIQSSAR